MEIHLADAAGVACVAISQRRLTDVSCALHHRWTQEHAGVPTPGLWAKTLGVLINEARSGGCRCVLARVVTRDTDVDPVRTAVHAEGLRAVLGALGFHRGGTRVEFRLALQTPAVDTWLQHASEDPFRWDALAPAGSVPLDRAARVFKHVAQGDPDADPDENPATCLRAMLDDPRLVGGSACVQVGCLETQTGVEEAAFVMAQANRGAGPSRVTYLGVAPEHRGYGFGRFVHARGLAMLRAQGGTFYQGGTSTQNAPMLALFRALGAEEASTMEEWSLAT